MLFRSGKPVTIYNLAASKRGIVDLVDNNSTTNSRKYNGFDVGFTARRGKLNTFGGISTGHTVANTCDVEDPNQATYCDQSMYDIPFMTQVKLAGSYPLPGGINVSAVFQALPGPAINPTWVAANEIGRAHV